MTMGSKPCAILASVVLLAWGAVFVYGQRFRNFRIVQNSPPPTELVVARWSYHAMGKFGGTGWSHNYPTSDQHISQVISEATNINTTGMSYRIVELGSPGCSTIRSLLFPSREKWR